MSGLMRGAGELLTGFDESFGRAQGRQDVLRDRATQRDIQKQEIERLQAERDRIIQGENATNMLISGAMSGGLMSLSPDDQEVFTAEQAYSMPVEKQESLFGASLAGADMGKVLAVKQAMTPKNVKANIKTIEMNGPEGFGTYVVNLDSETSRPRFLGGPEPKSLTPEENSESFKLERQFAKEWETVAKDFKAADQSYTTIKTAGNEGTGVGDIGMIFAMMKMFDPGSVVRESEFALAQNADSVAGILQSQYARLKDGEKLRPEQREKFLDLAEKLYNSTNDLYGRRLNEFRGAAGSYGFDVNRTIADVKRGGWKNKKAPIGKDTPLEISHNVKKKRFKYNPETGDFD